MEGKREEGIEKGSEKRRETGRKGKGNGREKEGKGWEEGKRKGEEEKKGKGRECFIIFLWERGKERLDFLP